MSSLRRTAAVAAVLSCLPLVPALAVAPVERTRVGAVTLELADGSGSTVRLALRVWDGGTADRVDVRVESCDATGCSYPEFYVGVVDAGTAELDPTATAGRAALALGGHDLALSWQPAESSGAVVSAGDLQSSEQSFTGGTYVGAPAAVAVVTADGTCTATGAVGDGLRVALPEGSSGAARPLDALRLPAGALGCASA